MILTTAAAASAEMGGHGAPSLVMAITWIGVLGIGAQWLAWRLNLPAIVLMAIAGLLAGPVFGVLSPEETFGEMYRPAISVAVAIILFEGGLQLKFSELRGLERGVLRLVIASAPLAWIFGALAGHYVAGISWPTAILFAGIMIVTGPTVILPLLRQAKLMTRPAALLKWEGIINDPIGALAAVITFEYIVAVNGAEFSGAAVIASLVVGTILCTAWGIAIGLAMAKAFREGWVPEYLKSPVLLASVLLAFSTSNLLQEEGGLLAVTAMGVTMANARMPSINQLRHFKENIAVLFVSGVFIMLTANLSLDIFEDVSWRTAAFVVVMLVVVRPAAVLLGTIGTDLKWSERLLVGWIAPRGIVAVAVSGLFATSMTPENGFLDGSVLVPLSFAMVFATVVLHGFTIKPLGKALDLASKSAPGVLIVGASAWSVALAKRIKEIDVPVLVADTNYRSLRQARQAGIDTYYGEILSEVSEHHIEFVRYGYLLALSGNEAHNALVCMDLAPEMNRAAIYQLTTNVGDENRTAMSSAVQGRALLRGNVALEELLRRHWEGWVFQFTKLSETYNPEKYLEDLPKDALLVMVKRKGVLIFESDEQPIKLQVGDRVLAFVPKEIARVRQEKESEANGAEPDGEIEAKKQEAIEKVSP